MSRVIIVSNRLPVTARCEGGAVDLTRSAGGLATGLASIHEEAGRCWVGWPGDLTGADQHQRARLEAELQGRGLVPVHLSPDEVEGFYERVANGMLWPVFHGLLDSLPLEAQGWDEYVAVNQRFARAVAASYRTGDLVWIHDYQLALVPALVRKLLPAARIGFFLHIPFPPVEAFRVLPWRRELLLGLLGSDLIGFHTSSYREQFARALRDIAGLDGVPSVRAPDGRLVQLDVFPMGIDARHWAELARDPSVRTAAQALRNDARGRSIVLGIDRLDYTKGIPRRLLALARLFAREPELATKVRFVQVCVPSRGDIEAYAAARRRVDEIVGRINGQFGTAESVPIHCIHRHLPEEDLATLYLAADVMLVTPLCDGMNLVAKEFVATRVDNAGMLVLSEFAGAAAELDAALLVNPYDLDCVAVAVQRALAMTDDERRSRMGRLRLKVHSRDVRTWATSFLQALKAGDNAAAPPDGVASAGPRPVLA